MIIEKIRFKYILIFLVITISPLIIYFLSYYDEPNFTLDGDSSILKNLIVNVESLDITNNKNNYIRTLLYKGEITNIKPKYADFYNIYANYNGKIKKMEVEIIFGYMSGDNNRINNVIVLNKNGRIFLRYYQLKTMKNEGISKEMELNIPIEKIKDPIEKEKYTKYYK